MTLKRGLFLAAILTLSIQFNASAQVPDAQPPAAPPAPVVTDATAEVNATPPAPADTQPQASPAQPVTPPAQPPAEAPLPAGQPPLPESKPAETQPAQPQPPAPAPEQSAPVTQPAAPVQPEQPSPAQPATSAPVPAEQPAQPQPPAPQQPAAPDTSSQPAAGTTAVEAQPPAPASNAMAVSAKDFILKQEELSYGVTLISKAVKMRIPFESNPILIENKDQIKTVAGRMFQEVKELADNLNAMAINLMSYKKDDKDHDFGLIALELKESSRADAEVFKGLIKTSMMSYFKEETFFIADKFPLIVIIAHNYPEGKKEDIKWAFDLAQKKFEK